MHRWGDKDVDWEGINDAAEFIAERVEVLIAAPRPVGPIGRAVRNPAARPGESLAGNRPLYRAHLPAYSTAISST